MRFENEILSIQELLGRAFDFGNFEEFKIAIAKIDKSLLDTVTLTQNNYIYLALGDLMPIAMATDNGHVIPFQRPRLLTDNYPTLIGETSKAYSDVEIFNGDEVKDVEKAAQQAKALLDLYNNAKKLTDPSLEEEIRLQRSYDRAMYNLQEAKKKQTALRKKFAEKPYYEHLRTLLGREPSQQEIEEYMANPKNTLRTII